MQTIKSRSVAALGAILATFVTVAAAAPAHGETGTARVAYGDLNLRSPAAREVLAHRIAVAATEACGTSDPLFRFQVAACRRDSIARAKASVAGIQAATKIAAR